jgi:hypothetical protein
MGAAGLFITDGALTVYNAGSTVVIDGTSNMFKIVATGTQYGGFPTTLFTSNTYNVTLSSLGVYTAVPATVSFVAIAPSSGIVLSTVRYDSVWVAIDAAGGVGGMLSSGVYVDGDGYVITRLIASNGTANYQTSHSQFRYYVLKEGSI